MPKTTGGWGFRISGEGNFNSECGVPTFETGLQNQGQFEIIKELKDSECGVLTFETRLQTRIKANLRLSNS